MHEKLSGKKLLVTGGAGFIGSNLCEYFIANDNEVVCLDNLSTGFLHNIEHLLDHPKFTFLQGDIRNIADCERAVSGCDLVFHQAALGSVPRSIQDPVTTNEVNIGGFVNMLHAAVKAGVSRFIYAASSSTYGDSKELPKVEHQIGNALSPYAITKYVNELYARNFSEIYGIETVGLRYFNVFGRRQNPDGAYAAVIPKFVLQLMRGESPVVNGDGSVSRDFTYIDNVLHANERAGLMPTILIKANQEAYYNEKKLPFDPNKTIAEVINVACGERTTLAELLDYLKAFLSIKHFKIGEIEIQYGPVRNGDIPHSLASVEKGALIFGYQPRYLIKTGLELASDWYWEHLIIE